MFEGKLKKNDNILIYSVKDVTQNIDYLILLQKNSVYVEQFSTWECCEYKKDRVRERERERRNV